jgi:hypothetical protein
MKVGFAHASLTHTNQNTVSFKQILLPVGYNH